jgi:hypothetical protein
MLSSAAFAWLDDSRSIALRRRKVRPPNVDMGSISGELGGEATICMLTGSNLTCLPNALQRQGNSRPVVCSIRKESRRAPGEQKLAHAHTLANTRTHFLSFSSTEAWKRLCRGASAGSVQSVPLLLGRDPGLGADVEHFLLDGCAQRESDEQPHGTQLGLHMKYTRMLRSSCSPGGSTQGPGSLYPELHRNRSCLPRALKSAEALILESLVSTAEREGHT